MKEKEDILTKKYNRKTGQHTNRGKLVILKRQDKVVSLLFQDGCLIRASAKEDVRFGLGDIVIGKVQNVAKNIQAAFVSLGGDTICFLPLEQIKQPFLVNRAYDGRILAGDDIVVQISREAVKSKDAVADAALSFTGRYAVIHVQSTGQAILNAPRGPGPGIQDGGRKICYSAKLRKKDRLRLDGFFKTKADSGTPLEELLPDGFTLIVRTNAGNLPDELLQKALWEEIKALSLEAQDVIRKVQARTCYSILKKAPPAYLSVIRDTYEKQYDAIVTDDEELYQNIKEYLQANQPEDLDKLSLYNDAALPLNCLYGIEGKLRQALSRKVWLKSGGYLVIEPTEALTVIDVNTGKYISNKNAQETFWLINKEACEEIAVQIPLRNLSGIILVDFINMKEECRQKELIAYLAGLLQKDSVQTSVIDMTPLGLVEITRKKVNKSLAEQFS